MLVKDLPIEIQKVVLSYQEKYGNIPTSDIDLRKDLDGGNFDWIDEEGDNFWDRINDGDFDGFYERYPRVEDLVKIEEDLFAFFKS